MANTYFQFKQFKIEQANCANKVSTDACVFGAWLNEYMEGRSILDVGCGSGLLSLMLAQGEGRKITGIEIEQHCAEQAKENLLDSPFTNLEVIQADMRTWECPSTFDFIISNPPFFNNSSKNPDDLKNQARQTESLGPTDWEHLLKRAARKDTTIALLLSNNDVLTAYQKEFDKLGFSNQKIVRLLDTQKSDCKRVILLASQSQFQRDTEESFYYKKPDGSYSERFVDLLRDYYLYL